MDSGTDSGAMTPHSILAKSAVLDQLKTLAPAPTALAAQRGLCLHSNVVSARRGLRRTNQLTVQSDTSTCSASFDFAAQPGALQKIDGVLCQ